MIELLLDNKDGKVWDLSSIVSDISWKTTRIGRPGSLEFTLVRGGIFQAKDFKINTGDVISFRYDSANVFYGYVFKLSESNDEAVKILCYDQIRYLQSSDTYAFAGATAADVLRRIAGDFGLKLGRVDDTGYRIPTLLEDNQKLIDIICKALDLTLINGGRNYFLYDDFGGLSLRDSESMLLEFFVGDSSLMTGYGAERSIDSDTYNRIKLYRDNKKSGKRDTYIAQDSASMARWGVLQLSQSVDENMNDAQISDMLNTLIAVKNRETRTLKVDAIGDVRVRAGCYVPIVIGERGINQPFLVDTCSHRFDGGDHTMTLELKVI
ncbi:XkdQ/YqbQ family protein [Cohnella cellulosilytica]|uniref:YqbQ/XkdQ domain-containing protein n=1 Tax=Cohnella cellulosilytica TaxID=986710 RepID=A0ABW2FH69_9BACL